MKVLQKMQVVVMMQDQQALVKKQAARMQAKVLQTLVKVRRHNPRIENYRGPLDMGGPLIKVYT
jgi:hypothetical protein